MNTKNFKSRLTRTRFYLLLASLGLLLSACGVEDSGIEPAASGHDSPANAYERGPHGGRLLHDGEFSLELAIFETGVPPEFRAWLTNQGVAINPSEVHLEVRLTRLGNTVDQIGFEPQEDFLRGNQLVYEPHSFGVAIDAQVGDTKLSWSYENFEGRTRIDDTVAAGLELETEVAGPATIRQAIEVYGRIEPIPERVSSVSARFDGLILSVHAAQGDVVREGQVLLSIESDESLKPYPVKSPIGGTVTMRNANAGETTAGRALFTITDTSSVWANLAIFPAELSRVQVGALVSIASIGGESLASGVINRMGVVTGSNQAVMARVVLDNSDGLFFPGARVRAEVQVAEFDVPLAVKREGLQSFRDFTVVYAKVGDEYEVRMLELGRQDRKWVEVLGGLEAGTRYVTANSYVIKADIEKSGASHDH